MILSSVSVFFSWHVCFLWWRGIMARRWGWKWDTLKSDSLSVALDETSASAWTSPRLSGSICDWGGRILAVYVGLSPDEPSEVPDTVRCCAFPLPPSPRASFPCFLRYSSPSSCFFNFLLILLSLPYFLLHVLNACTSSLSRTLWTQYSTYNIGKLSSLWPWFTSI